MDAGREQFLGRKRPREKPMDIRQLPLEDIVLDPNLNLRDRLDDFTVERYADAWERLPPVTVFEVDGHWLMADGFHRYAAAVMRGCKTIPAEIRLGAFADALDFVAGVNLFHGLPLTRAERRRAVEVKLKLHHEWSDRRLSEELAVSRDLVAKMRRQLQEGNQIPTGVGRVGADGKTYPAQGHPKDPNERLPKGPAIAQQDDPRDRGRRESDPAPWDDTSAALGTPVGRPVGSAIAPWHDIPPEKAAALAEPVEPVAPTIDEMLEMMAKQIIEVIHWTRAEGFSEAYSTAKPGSRGLFQTAALKLAARAGELRKGI